MSKLCILYLPVFLHWCKVVLKRSPLIHIGNNGCICPPQNISSAMSCRSFTKTYWEDNSLVSAHFWDLIEVNVEACRLHEHAFFSLVNARNLTLSYYFSSRSCVTFCFMDNLICLCFLVDYYMRNKVKTATCPNCSLFFMPLSFFFFAPENNKRQTHLKYLNQWI